MKEYRNEKGLLHRIDGPAVIYNNGDMLWYKEGARHRTDGPAIEYIYGKKEWWVMGKLHRTNGPAVKGSDGSMLWFINGEKITEQEHINIRLRRQLIPKEMWEI